MIVDDYITLPNRIKNIYDDCKPEEQKYLIKILEELSTMGYSPSYDTLWLQDFKEIPVDVLTFVCDERYLGSTNNSGDAIYPYWKSCMTDIFEDFTKYQEVVFTGATRIGKTSTAITCAAYMLYWLMCLRDPQEFFGKKEVSKFSLHFFNVTKDLAAGVAYRELNDTLKQSMWFCEHGTFSKSERNFYYIPEGGKVVIDYGSSYSDALGQQVFVAIMDECNFARSGIKDINKAKANMKELYDVVVARVEGTFRLRGKVYGKMFSVSSKKTDSDFLEDHVQAQLQAGNTHLFVADKPQWEVLPPEMFSPEKFYIAVGDRHKKGFVVENESPEALEELQELGYTLMKVPIDMKTNFIADFDISLRDIAGISVPGALSYITQDTITQCLGSRKNPFTMDVLEIGTQDVYTIEEYFHKDNVDSRLLRCPMFIHIDLSKSDDKTGIGCVCISGRKDVETEDGRTVSMPSFSQVFTISLKAPRGDKIPYAKITNFIVWLRRNHYDINIISKDTFQSEYMGQLLEAQGFTVKDLSLDRTPDGYMALRSIMMERRIDLLDVELYQNELIHLQRDGLSGKIDHPVGGCFVENTKIAIIEDDKIGFKMIKDLLSTYKDYQVVTYNTKKAKVQFKDIKNVWKTKKVSSVLEIELKTNNRFSKFQCTEDHKFMMSTRGYRQAKYLNIGDNLLTVDDSLPSIYVEGHCEVVGIEKIDKICDVYDLEIKDTHNFLLYNGCFVHNSKDASDALAGSVWSATMDNPGIKVDRGKVANAITSVNRPHTYSGNKSELDNLFPQMPKR